MKHWNRRMKKRINILFLMVFACLSCGKSAIDAEVKQEGVCLNISESILSVETKGPILSNGNGGEVQFPKNSTYGLFICDHVAEGPNPYIEHAPNYNNIRASNSNKDGTWMYKQGDAAEFPIIFLMGKKTEDDKSVCADIFAYAPYNKIVTTPECIEFEILDQDDIMYAIQNKDASINKGIDPLADALKVDVPLTFAHALTLLEFNLELKNDKFNHPDAEGYVNGNLVDFITISKTSTADCPLYSGGTLNAVDGVLTPKNDVESLTVKCANTTSRIGDEINLKAYLLLVPTEPDDDEYIFSIHLNNIVLNSVYHLKKEHLKHGDSNEYGFKAGYKYTFNFIIDNYIRFTGVEFGKWTTVEEPLYQIVI